VVSPHLDDGVLSLGAAITRATSRGADVMVLTVLAGDPDSDGPASAWDTFCGFPTAGVAARARRVEDRRACALLGATPEWLPFSDEQYGHGADEDTIWSSVEPHLEGADLVLTPGFPLHHGDHAFVTSMLLSRLPGDAPLALYVEQPYANFAVMGRGFTREPMLTTLRIALRTESARKLQEPALSAGMLELVPSRVSWNAAGTPASDRRKKNAAIRAYESQLRGLGRWLTRRIGLYEHGWGGEGIGLVGGRAASG
jgi:LmbE family N-acetylglucosaminyl deacetylase